MSGTRSLCFGYADSCMLFGHACAYDIINCGLNGVSASGGLMMVIGSLSLD